VLSGFDASSGAVAWQAVVDGTDPKRMQQRNEILKTVDSIGGSFFLDIRTGRVMAQSVRADRRSGDSAVLTSAGFLVYLTPDSRSVCTVRDVRSRIPGAGQALAVEPGHWRVLGVGERYVAVEEARKKERHIIDVANPGGAIPLPPVPAGDDGRRYPVHVWFDRDTAVLLHARAVQDDELLAPCLTAYALPKCDTVWQCDLDDGDDGLVRMGEPEVFGNTMAWTIHYVQGSPPRPVVADLVSGTLTECAPAMPGDAADAVSHSPVVMNGRVLVEYNGGIACLLSME
jgi:hypothetical protein